MNDIELDKLKKCQLNILLELDRVCTDIGIQYCLAFGSCLGAIRHKGFIPWDDDIDVYMKAADLEKLKRHSNLFREHFFLQTQKTDPNYGLMIARLRDSRTTLIEETEKDRDINQGVFIDIYPLFNCPSKGIKLRYLQVLSMMCRLMMYGKAPRNRGTIMRVGSQLLLFSCKKSIRSYFIDFCYNRLLSEKRTGFVSTFYGDEARIVYREKCFFPCKRVPFENIYVWIPRNADGYLQKTYGDYMRIPPKEKRTIHHSYSFFDTNNSYILYKGKFYCQEKK